MTRFYQNKIYDGRSPLRRPGHLIRGMVRDLIGSRRLGWELFLRDLKAQYKQALLGGLWLFVPPLVSSLIFLFLSQASVFHLPAPKQVPLFLFLLLGASYWQLFVDLLLTPSRLIESAKILLVKLQFPREALPIAALLSVSFNFLIRFAIVLVAGFFTDYFPSLNGLVFAVVGALPLIFMGLFLGILVSPLVLLFRDVGPTLMLLCQFLLFLSPVGMYFPSLEKAPWYIFWNPMTYLLGFPRDAFFALSTETLRGVIGLSIVSAFLLVAAWVVFRVTLPHALERLGV